MILDFELLLNYPFDILGNAWWIKLDVSTKYAKFADVNGEIEDLIVNKSVMRRR